MCPCETRAPPAELSPGRAAWAAAMAGDTVGMVHSLLGQLDSAWREIERLRGESDAWRRRALDAERHDST